MPYKIYTDKNENFECEVAVKNASLKGSIARLVVESINGPNLVFKGRIDGDKCIIPIKRVKGLLEERSVGKMYLEVVVEDTYFKPWESDFIVEEHTSVKVRVNEQKQSSTKPMVEIKTQPVSKYVNKPNKSKKLLESQKRFINVYVPLKELSMICERFNIKKSNLKKQKIALKEIIKEYFKANPEYKNSSKQILSRITTFLN